MYKWLPMVLTTKHSVQTYNTINVVLHYSSSKNNGANLLFLSEQIYIQERTIDLLHAEYHKSIFTPRNNILLAQIISIRSFVLLCTLSCQTKCTVFMHARSGLILVKWPTVLNWLSL